VRVTKEHLENQVLMLNEFTGQPKEPYSKNENGEYKSNIGNYNIGWAYGGCKLEQIVSEGGAVREITNYRLTKRELYYVLHSMNNMLRSELDTKLLTEQTKDVYENYTRQDILEDEELSDSYLRENIK
tara:strand:+ start:331 stop:714 length:384 start_codon:yes stop_codon:yes gene_type:complete